MALIPDVPESIEIQMERTKFFVSKVIDKVADDVLDESVDGNDDPIIVQNFNQISTTSSSVN
jgi:hypothetical protein